MLIFEVTKKFPKEETYSLTDQIRRSSRSVYANLAKLGGSGAIRQLSSLKYLMLKEKLRKPKCGFNLPSHSRRIPTDGSEQSRSRKPM